MILHWQLRFLLIRYAVNSSRFSFVSVLILMWCLFEINYKYSGYSLNLHGVKTGEITGIAMMYIYIKMETITQICCTNFVLAVLTYIRTCPFLWPHVHILNTAAWLVGHFWAWFLDIISICISISLDSPCFVVSIRICCLCFSLGSQN